MDRIYNFTGSLQRKHHAMYIRFRENPLIFFVSAVITLTIIACYFQLVEENSDNHFISNSPLLKSKTFLKVVKCTDRFDGVQCFNNQKQKLIKEATYYGLSKKALNHLVDCFSSLTSNASDLALLLNIQNCYQQSDSIEMYQQLTAPKFSFIRYLSVIIFQLSVFFYFLSHTHRSITKDIEEVEGEIKHCKSIQDSLLFRCSTLSTNLAALKTKFKADIATMQGRLNKGGNIRRELDNLKLKIFFLEQREASLSRVKAFEPARILAGTPDVFKGELHNNNLLLDNKSKFLYSLQQQKFRPQLENEDLQSSKNPNSSKLADSRAIVAQVGSQKFDLTDKDGIAKWKVFCQNSSLNPSSMIKLDDNHGFDKPICFNMKENNEDVNSTIASSPKYYYDTRGDDENGGPKAVSENLMKTDKNGKPYRRLFIPGQGWKSAKKLQEGKL